MKVKQKIKSNVFISFRNVQSITKLNFEKIWFYRIDSKSIEYRFNGLRNFKSIKEL